MVSGSEVVGRERWQAIVLSYVTWSGQSPEPLRLRVP